MTTDERAGFSAARARARAARDDQGRHAPAR